MIAPLLWLGAIVRRDYSEQRKRGFLRSPERASLGIQGFPPSLGRTSPSTPRTNLDDGRPDAVPP